MAVSPRSYTGTEMRVQGQGLTGQGKSTQRARPGSPEWSSQELIAADPGTHAWPRRSPSGSDPCSLPLAHDSLGHRAPCCSLPLLLPRERAVLSSQENAPSLVETLALHTTSSFARWVTNREAFQQKLTLPIPPKTPNQVKGTFLEGAVAAVGP